MQRTNASLPTRYKRAVEFRRVCEILRNHIQVQTKFDPKWKDREPPTPESLQTHLETRFAQLHTAVEMELWQEAYRTVEDVHLLLQQMKKMPKPSSMASYYSQLSQIFWVANNEVRSSPWHTTLSPRPNSRPV